jgi:hypothetical protein
MAAAPWRGNTFAETTYVGRQGHALGPALELWLQRNPAALGGVIAAEEAAHRLTLLRGAARPE